MFLPAKGTNLSGSFVAGVITIAIRGTKKEGILKRDKIADHTTLLTLEYEASSRWSWLIRLLWLPTLSLDCVTLQCYRTRFVPLLLSPLSSE